MADDERCTKCGGALDRPFTSPNYCSNCTSRDKRAEAVCGRRRGGNPVLEPWELDYFCPLCGKPPAEVLAEDPDRPDEGLHFSEYNYFMWCERCNVDVPWPLCLKTDSKKALETYTDRFLSFIEEVTTRAKKPPKQDGNGGGPG